MTPPVDLVSGDNSTINLDPAGLADNGGPTQTIALISGDPLNGASPGCDAINDLGVPVPDDQRYFPRPFGAACDSGAFETQPTGMLTVEKTTIGTELFFIFLGTGFPEGCNLMDEFFLDDMGMEMCMLPLGTFTVEEVILLAGFGLDIMCTETPSSETPTSVTIDIGDMDDVTCTFTNTRQFTLNVTLGGTGDGTVTSAPAGINCGEGNVDCMEAYDIDTEVNLLATPDADSFFASWSGDTVCTGTDPNLTITMDTAITCTATFTEDPTITVNKAGNGDGTITSSPAINPPSGINCAPGCTTDTAEFAELSMVELTATPDAVSEFVEWSGDCSGVTQMITVTADGAKTCTATFNFIPGLAITLLPVDPGEAGVVNTLSVIQAIPNGLVGFIYGFTQQAGVDGSSICPGLQVDIANFRPLFVVPADLLGDASASVLVPRSVAGVTVLLQAIDLTTCSPSNVQEQTF